MVAQSSWTCRPRHGRVHNAYSTLRRKVVTDTSPLCTPAGRWHLHLEDRENCVECNTWGVCSRYKECWHFWTPGAWGHTDPEAKLPLSLDLLTSVIMLGYYCITIWLFYKVQYYIFQKLFSQNFRSYSVEFQILFMKFLFNINQMKIRVNPWGFRWHFRIISEQFQGFPVKLLLNIQILFRLESEGIHGDFR